MSPVSAPRAAGTVGRTSVAATLAIFAVSGVISGPVTNHGERSLLQAAVETGDFTLIFVPFPLMRNMRLNEVFPSRCLICQMHDRGLRCLG